MPWSRTMRTVLIAGVSLVSLASLASLAATMPAAPPQGATLERLTPILVVDSIELTVPFWEALGFRATSPARVDGKLTFIAFVKEGYSIHYQTLAFIEENIPGATEMLSGNTTLLYLAFDDLDTVIAALGDAEVVIPRRKTPWGADEIYVKEPGGNIIGFAKFGRN